MNDQPVGSQPPESTRNDRSHHATRRDFCRHALVNAAAWAGTAALPHVSRADNQTSNAGPVAFFVIGDTHFLANKSNLAELDSRSQEVTSRLVDKLNELPGTALPPELGGAQVAAPRGVIHAGDMIDTGDKLGQTFRDMQATEWANYKKEYGLTGRDGRLKWPVYEVYGNHDGPQGKGVAIDGLRDRNHRRTGIANLSENELHYSFDWAPLHFVNLGIVVGAAPGVKRTRRYDPLDSLAFLQHDLEKHVGATGKPVILTHHIDLVRYMKPAPADKPGPLGEWDPADVQAYFDAIKKYNVVAIFYGHTHSRNVFRWTGDDTSDFEKGKGAPVFNVDNSSHFNLDEQGFFYVTIEDKSLVVREYRSPDRWLTGAWSKASWRVSLS